MSDADADAGRARFAATAEKLAALQAQRAPKLAEEVRAFLAPKGDERALDSATGTGALAFALAPLVREVVAADVVPELLALARRRAEGHPNVTFVDGDATHLPFDSFSFDLGCTMRSLHHIARPELAVAELVRVTRPGGRLLVVDQIAPTDPLVALEVDRFERERDPAHTRLLSDADMRALFDANGLRLTSSTFAHEQRELEVYLDLAGCDGERRRRAAALAPGPVFTTELAWYLLERH